MLPAVQRDRPGRAARAGRGSAGGEAAGQQQHGEAGRTALDQAPTRESAGNPAHCAACGHILLTSFSALVTAAADAARVEVLLVLSVS